MFRLQLKYVLLIVWLAILGTDAAAKATPEARLIDELLTKRGYNSLARPVENPKDALTVKLGITLQQIINLDLQNANLKLLTWLNYEWTDYQLSWDVSEYSGIESVRIAPDKIWTPDIELYNSVEMSDDNYRVTSVVVYNDGKISWVKPTRTDTSCAIDIMWFPFDVQYCKLKFGSWAYDGGKINLTRMQEYIDLSTYQYNPEYYLTEASSVRSVIQYECCPETYIDITYTLQMQRRALYYVYHFVIPCALSSLLILAIFILPSDNAAKIWLGVSILIVLSCYQLCLTNIIPTTTISTALLGRYLMFCVVLCVIAILMASIILHLHHRSSRQSTMPASLKKVCTGLARVLLFNHSASESKTPVSNNEKTGVHLEPVEVGVNIQPVESFSQQLQAFLNQLTAPESTDDWKIAASVIDRLCLVTFTVIYILGTVLILVCHP